MKNKWKHVLYTLITVNLVAIGLYEYYYFFVRPKTFTQLEPPTISKDDLPNFNGEFIPYDSYTPLGYGTVLKNFILRDIKLNNIEISQSNNFFKYLLICRPNSSKEIQTEQLYYILELYNKFSDSNILFAFLYSGKFSNPTKAKLNELQNRYQVRFIEITYDFLKEHFKISERADGVFFLLDDKNRVRMANLIFNVEVMKNIIIREIGKNIL